MKAQAFKCPERSFMVVSYVEIILFIVQKAFNVEGTGLQRLIPGALASSVLNPGLHSWRPWPSEFETPVFRVGNPDLQS